MKLKWDIIEIEINKSRGKKTPVQMINRTESQFFEKRIK